MTLFEQCVQHKSVIHQRQKDKKEDNMAREMVVVLDFGGQYKQLIARRVRECNVYCEIHPYNIGLDKLREMNPKGIILTGGPNSVYGENAVLCEKELYELGVPVMGICYGAQLTAFLNGGEVKTAPVSEYGKTETNLDTSSELFADCKSVVTTWMSHTDYIAKAPEGFKILTALWQLWRMLTERFMQFSSILRLCTPSAEHRCLRTL